jgi:hypothetical protein
VNYYLPRHNILKGLSAPVTVYLDTKHCGLKQCNSRPALATQSCKGSGGRVGLSFCWDAFDIERKVEEKMVSSSFGGVAGRGMWTPGDGLPWAWVRLAPHVGTPSTWAD